MYIYVVPDVLTFPWLYLKFNVSSISLSAHSICTFLVFVVTSNKNFIYCSIIYFNAIKWAPSYSGLSQYLTVCLTASLRPRIQNPVPIGHPSDTSIGAQCDPVSSAVSNSGDTSTSVCEYKTEGCHPGRALQLEICVSTTSGEQDNRNSGSVVEMNRGALFPPSFSCVWRKRSPWNSSIARFSCPDPMNF